MWVLDKKIILSNFLLCLFGVLVYVGGVLWVNHNINKIESTYAEVESNANTEENMAVLRSIEAENQTEIAALRGFFIGSGDELKFIEEIESLASEEGLLFEILSISPDPKGTTSVSEDLLIKINARGSWRQVVTFVDRLEKRPFGVSIKRVGLNTEGKGVWLSSIDLTVFKEKVK